MNLPINYLATNGCSWTSDSYLAGISPRSLKGCWARKRNTILACVTAAEACIILPSSYHSAQPTLQSSNKLPSPFPSPPYLLWHDPGDPVGIYAGPLAICTGSTTEHNSSVPF